MFAMAAMLSLVLSAQVSYAANLLWDANGTGGGQTDGAGTWLTANQWWDSSGSSNATWNNSVPDNATIGNSGNGGTITLGAVTAGSVLFTNFLGTYTLSSGALTNSSGIMVASNAGVVTINSVIGGTGGITKNSSAKMNLGGANTYTGTTTVNAGVLMADDGGSLGGGNLVLNGGVLEHYWGGNDTRALGPGNGQVQLPGGASGWSENGLSHSVIISNNASFVVVWGTTYFNPSALVLQANTAQANTIRNSSLTFANILDLNGANRTIAVDQIDAGVYGNGATISGVISNSSGTAAGLIKAGVGHLTLSAANKYNGGTIITNGTLIANNQTALGSGTVGITNGVLRLTSSLTISNLEGNAAATINLGAGGTVLTVNQVGTNTFAGAITNAGAFTKSGAGMLTLSGTNTYSGVTTIKGGTLWGVAGGSCSNSAITVTNSLGSTAAFGVYVTNSAMQWTCSNLTFLTNGAGAQLKFSFDVTPSTMVAPLNITNNLVFNGAPVIVVNLNLPVQGGTYPLLTVGGSAPSEVPAMTGTTGILAWDVTGKTLSLTTPSAGLVITVR